jgi:nitrile hydratase beta subunit
MNGVHDMGGMHGMGPIRHEKNEPVFHAPWEGRVYAIDRALSSFHRWNIDAWRHHIETLPPAEYLRMSYYEKWLAANEKRVVQYGFVTAEELANGKAAQGSTKAVPALTVEVARAYERNIPSANDPSVAPLFQTGQRVRARNIQPEGHTRLLRYARGKTGQIIRDHGVYSFPDSSAQGMGDKRQHLYSVRFAARELWGEAASPRDFVHLDLWDSYLEHALEHA